MSRSAAGRVLIVEDELLVAVDMHDTIEDLGFEVVGIAPDMATAMQHAHAKPDIALVDVNLRDGPTGAQIGALLSMQGVAVIFITANPRMLGPGVPGALGVLSKPFDETSIGSTLFYALCCQRGEPAVPPPELAAFAKTRTQQSLS
jgi:response regulator of citrate/malate metabolism